MAATQALTPSQGSTYSNPRLDGALQNVSGDFDTWARSIGTLVLSEARKADRQTGSNGANGSAASVNAPIDYKYNATVHVTADAGDSLVQLAFETPQGNICMNIPIGVLHPTQF